MTRQIIIDFDPDPDDRHLGEYKVWLFGEALYHLCQKDGWASIPIEEVDKATNQLKVTVFSKRRIRHIHVAIERLLEKHFLADRARLSETVAPGGDVTAYGQKGRG